MTPKDNFIKDCKIKVVKGKKYYYLDTKFVYYDGIYKHSKIQETYIAPVDCKKSELDFKVDLAGFKLFLKAVKFYHEMTEKHYKSTILSKKELKKLVLLKLAYSGFLHKFTKTDLDRYKQVAYTKYVYGTTSIEGNTYTLRETDVTLNEGITVGGKEKREFYEIENYGKLQAYLNELKTITFDLNLVKKIHSIILQNIDDDSAGEFRKIDVGIRGTKFEPIPAILVQEELNKLFDWFDENIKTMNEIEIIAAFHQRFEEIHPFKDGNGRVGRELVRILLHIHNLPTIFIDKANREEYLKCLDEGNNGDNNALTKFFYNNLIVVHTELLKNATTIIDQEIKDKRDDDRFKKIFSDKRTKKLLAWLEE